MTDKELLELAAKAAGIDGVVYAESRGGWDEEHAFPAILYYSNGQRDAYGKGWWNPLTDDGDALRLAVKLGLAIRVLEKCVCVESDPETLLGQSQYSELEMYGNSDPYAATRRAIVRAAAEIGKRQQKAADTSVDTFTTPIKALFVPTRLTDAELRKLTK